MADPLAVRSGAADDGGPGIRCVSCRQQYRFSGRAPTPTCRHSGRFRRPLPTWVDAGSVRRAMVAVTRRSGPHAVTATALRGTLEHVGGELHRADRDPASQDRSGAHLLKKLLGLAGQAGPILSL